MRGSKFNVSHIGETVTNHRKDIKVPGPCARLHARSCGLHRFTRRVTALRVELALVQHLHLCTEPGLITSLQLLRLFDDYSSKPLNEARAI